MTKAAGRAGHWFPPCTVGVPGVMPETWRTMPSGCQEALHMAVPAGQADSGLRALEGISTAGLLSTLNAPAQDLAHAAHLFLEQCSLARAG